MQLSHEPGESFLSFRVRKSYGDFALDCEADFDGGVTAVFGPSGSGKTTLLDCIAGMISPDAGEIRVEGARVYSSEGGVDVAPERRRFGYVFQHGALFPHMSVRENISYGYALTPEPERSVEPDEVAGLLGISRLMDRGVKNLSGGERQRVALARALAASPRMLLLDEPLASLDAAHRASILTYLRHVSEQIGTPMVYVSHSLSEVMALASNTLAVADGKSVAYGPTAEVMARSEVARFADYSTLENIQEAEVIGFDPATGTHQGGDGAPTGTGGFQTRPYAANQPALLRVGDTVLVGPPTSAVAGERVTISIRAGDIILSLGVPPMTSARNAAPSVIHELREVGGRTLVYLDIGDRFVAEVTPASASELGLRVGMDVHAVIKSNSILVFGSEADSGAVG